MSTTTSKPKPKQAGLSEGKAGEKPVCGLIMPISATANFDEKRWADVQTILHRAIAAADFTPVNVWENSSTERVSFRIVGNVFKADVVIADVTDYNPNVMLELGLRLASKRPTIVVSSGKGQLPFDIRDYYVKFYPSDLNMLAMEQFVSELSNLVIEVQKAFEEDRYDPFIGDVVIDVISPEQRSISPQDAVLEGISEIQARLTSLEERTTRPSSGLFGLAGTASPANAGLLSTRYSILDKDDNRLPLYSVQKQNLNEVRQKMLSIDDVVDVLLVGGGRGKIYMAAVLNPKVSENRAKLAESEIDSYIRVTGEEVGVPIQANVRLPD